ncbi:Flagellar motor rotation protein MotB [hydrothermal vent metagenome]|uniref:Flagellar motor rotation protein MotB n=1 Tax=hydrothermal vent metagenome TaxID=652676 RepID=A0A3B1CJQ0_9ZZZZ
MEKKPASKKTLAIPCPQCTVKAKVPVERITKKGLIYACPKCKTSVLATRTDKGVSVRRATGAEKMDREEGSPPAKDIPAEIIKGAPSWIVTFADLATLLLTFFVLMLSFANMDIVKFQDLMGSVQEAYGVTKAERGQFQAVSKGRFAEVDSNIKKSPEVVAREKLVDIIYDSVIRAGFKGNASITSTDEGVRVRIKGRALFDPGKSELRPESSDFLKELSVVIKTTKDLIVVVEGHTDNRPIRTKKFPSNWELSTLRASKVLERMLKLGAPADRMSAAGYADTRPLFPNDREETRPLNRRVEFLFKRG